MHAEPKAMLGAEIRGDFKPPKGSDRLARPLALTIVRHVGAGKFAWVFEAQDARGARYAVKMLYRDDTQATRRFKREVKVLRQLPAHPNRVAYFGHGLHAGRPWVAMDFVDGFTLGAVLRQNRPVPEQAACALMIQLCDGFDGLHKLGLTHRDITPDNIMITNADRAVKLMDFGLVQDSQGLLQLYEQVDILQGDDFLDDLDAGLIAGTPEFMAPEQISDPHEKDRTRQKTDTTADVFALGTIFYQLVAARQLFPYAIGSRGAAGKQGLIHYLDYRTSFPDERLTCPSDIGPELWSILRKSLLRDPKHRQRDGAELAADLRFYLETGQGVLDDDMSATVAQDVDLAKIRAMASSHMSTRDFSAIRGDLGPASAPTLPGPADARSPAFTLSDTAPAPRRVITQGHAGPADEDTQRDRARETVTNAGDTTIPSLQEQGTEVGQNQAPTAAQINRTRREPRARLPAPGMSRGALLAIALGVCAAIGAVLAFAL